MPELIWSFGGEKTILPLPGLETQIFQPLDYSVYRLRYPKQELRINRFRLFPSGMHSTVPYAFRLCMIVLHL